MAEYNNLASVEALFREKVTSAAVILEPVAGNMGVVVPTKEFCRD